MELKASPLVFLLLGLAGTTLAIAEAERKSGLGDHPLAEYFSSEVDHLRDECLSDVHTLADWKAQRGQVRDQLFEMLSLSPRPPKTDLKPVVTGILEADGFTVEKLHFQSMPGLYVTGNLYLPKGRTNPAPAILYVCGHAAVITNGVSYGNKTAYQHHGAWFARNGYVCLIVDTVQLGELQGIHQGTYREGMWWWNSRGYTPAGVEAWNGLRALDYLQSRPEVDGDRLGVTGRSGGGASSWWITALDERVKVAAPVAGITDLQNHIVDGTVDGHCDCMFMVNTFRWDFPMVAALAAPRPLLIGNSDKDSIFPLDGVLRLHSKVARIYQLYGATNHLGLLITEGPHHDSQDLQLPVFRWFNRFLKGEDPLIEMAARPCFTADQLKVFDQLPSDSQNSKIQESFTAPALIVALPANSFEWALQVQAWRSNLQERVFRAWPKAPPPLHETLRPQESAGSLRLDLLEFTSEHDVTLRVYILRRESASNPPKQLRMILQDEPAWKLWVKNVSRTFPDVFQNKAVTNDAGTQSGFEMDRPGTGEILAFFAPRGIGPNAWDSDNLAQVQMRRRFMLLGQTLDSMRVWDARRALQVLSRLEGLQGLPITVESSGTMAANALYASLFESNVATLELSELPASHREGPDYLNVLRFLDLPQAVAMAAERNEVRLRGAPSGKWSFPLEIASKLGWPIGRLQVEVGAHPRFPNSE